MTHKEYLNLKLKFAKLKGQSDYYRANNKIEFFEPFKHQSKALELLRSGKKVVLLQGGNRIGKSVFGICVTGSACLGKQVWDGKDSIFGCQPIRCRIICIDWEHHAKEVIVPLLKEWLPIGSYETTKNNTGVEAFWKFKNGSTIELMTHIQDTKIHEGWKGHLVWADEPLPRDKYVANKRGLVDCSGVFLMTMTAVYEAWILDEIVLKNDSSIGCVTEIPMSSNPFLKEDDIKNYASSLSDDEQIARIHGGWLQLSGRVLKQFNKDIHAIEPFNVPIDYPVVAMIDVHLNKPQAVGFYAWDKHDRQFVIDEIWSHLSPEAVADEVIKRKKANLWNLQEVFIDPLAKGDSAYIKNRFGNVEDTFLIIEKKLMPHGIRLHCASKDKESGVRNLQDKLKGLNNIPSLFVFNNCERHIWEIQRWVYNEDGKPKKENDHFCENLYRSTLAGVKYQEPHLFTQPIANEVSGVI